MDSPMFIFFVSSWFNPKSSLALFTEHSFISDTVLGHLYTDTFHFIQHLCKARSIIPTLQMRSLKLRNSVTCSRKHSWLVRPGLNPRFSGSKSKVISISPHCFPFLQATVAVLRIYFNHWVSLSIMSYTISKHVLNACIIPELSRCWGGSRIDMFSTFRSLHHNYGLRPSLSFWCSWRSVNFENNHAY